MKRLGVIVNLTRTAAAAGLHELCALAKGLGIELLGDPAMCGSEPALTPCSVEGFAAAGAEGVISLGGDGSLLAAAHALADHPLPLIGFNYGNFGYLTAVNDTGIHSAMQALAEDRFTVENRTTLSARLVRNSQTCRVWPDALNDVVVSRTGGHAVVLDLNLDGRDVARYLCDGLILATPTGSTAYSLSAGGPVVVAATSALVLSILAPHALSARPLVFPDTTHITIRMAPQSSDVKACADGANEATLLPGDEVRITASPRPVQLILPEGFDPYLQLSRKLGWGLPFVR